MGKKVEAWCVFLPSGRILAFPSSLEVALNGWKDGSRGHGTIAHLVPATSEAEVRALRKVAKLAQVVVDEWGFSAPPDCRVWPTEAALIDALASLSRSLKPRNKKSKVKK